MRLVERLEKEHAMMTFGMGKIVRNERGISAILIAGIMFFLVFMVGFAVDMGYMYVVKGQLQNAADAGALAGAKKLVIKSTATVFDQYTAKSVARKFAECNNVAECKPFSDGVSLNPSTTYNTLDDTNDITVGNWNPSPPPGTLQYDETRTPINAIKVRTRRTSVSKKGQVNLFFSKVLSVVGYDWSKMSTAAEAIAAIPPRENVNILFCQNACDADATDPTNPKVLDPPRQMLTGDNGTNSVSFAYTSNYAPPTGPGANINALVCSNSTNIDVCGTEIFTTNGQTSDLQKLESVFYDPATPKDADGGWWVIVPISSICPPGKQGAGNDPKSITQYAKIRIIKVCATGGGKNGCPSRPDVKKSVNACASGENDFYIDRIACVSCANPAGMSGSYALLVK
jgi:Flp pilus assembly protein TadG